MSIVMGCTTRPYSALPFTEACHHIAVAGYTDVALFGNAGVDADSNHQDVVAARKIAEDSGLKPSMLLGRTRLDLGADAALDNYRRLIDNAALLGAAWLLDTGLDKETLYGQYLELMRRAAPHAQAAGVQITLKPHGGITRTTQDLVNAHRQVNHPAFGISYDPGNIIYYTKGAELPTTHIASVAPFVTTAIIKDCVIRDGTPDVMVTPGEGLVDFGGVLAALVAGGFRGPLYLECVGGKSVEEIDQNVRRTLGFIRGILAPVLP